MALRPRGLPRVPSGIDPRTASYLDLVRQETEGLPLSYFSSSDGPNSSNVTAPQGTLGIEVGSSNSVLWLKEDDDSASTGWRQVLTRGPVRSDLSVEADLDVGGILTTAGAITTGASNGDMVLSNGNALRAENPAGTAVRNLIQLSAFNNVSVGDPNQQLNISSDDIGGAQQVTAGANDSGGAGFRVLLIPNT